MRNIPFILWFHLLWNPFWFLYSGAVMVATHNLIWLPFMLLFAAFFLWAVRQCRRFQQLAD